MKNNIKEKLYDLIIKGDFKGDEDEILSFLASCAKEHQEIYWEVITEAIQEKHEGMLSLAFAAFMSSESFEYISENYRYLLINFLSTLEPVYLLELTEHLKDKTFGVGLGSRKQKMIKEIMEAWTIEDLKAFTIIYPKQIYSLIRLIHPKYNGEKGDIIKSII